MTDYTLVILLTLIGFIALAAILLVPVYRFLKREERANRDLPFDDKAGAAPSHDGEARNGR